MNRPSPEILVLGANPAWQKTLTFPRLMPGEVNRATARDAYAAGKGVNFCRAAACHGRCRTRLFQFSGGGNGERHEAELRTEGILFHRILTTAETRCCLTCLDQATGEMTELIEPSSPVTPEEASAMAALFAEHLPAAAGAAIVGSLPDGTDPELYFRITQLAKEQGVPILFDAVSGIAPALDLAERFVLKINRRELQKLTGEEVAETALTVARRRWPEAVFVITGGPEAAWLAVENETYRCKQPPLSILSPLGAGDTCSAVLFSELLCGTPVKEAFRLALAAANANCLIPRAGNFEPETRDEIASLLSVESFNQYEANYPFFIEDKNAY